MLRLSAAVSCVVALAAGGAVACSGSVETVSPGEGGGASSGGAESGGAPSSGGVSGSGGGGVSGVGASLGDGGTGGYVDPGCPDLPPPEPHYECDPLDPYADCADGLGCYPYVSHPYGTGCGTQQFGALCAFAGTGQHGDICGDGNGACAPGYLCVVGASAGKRCARLCSLEGEHDCPAGLICGETDVAGYGVCY